MTRRMKRDWNFYTVSWVKLCIHLFFVFRGHQYGKVIGSLRQTFWNPLRWVLTCMLVSEVSKHFFFHVCVLLCCPFTYPVIVMGKKILELNFPNKIWNWDLPRFDVIFVCSDPSWIHRTIISVFSVVPLFIEIDLFSLFLIWTANGDRGKQRDHDGENVSLFHPMKSSCR